MKQEQSGVAAEYVGSNDRRGPVADVALW